MRKDCQNLTTFLFLQPCYGHIFKYLNIYIVLSSNIEDIFLIMTYKIILSVSISFILLFFLSYYNITKNVALLRENYWSKNTDFCHEC